MFSALSFGMSLVSAGTTIASNNSTAARIRHRQTLLNMLTAYTGDDNPNDQTRTQIERLRRELRGIALSPQERLVLTRSRDQTVRENEEIMQSLWLSIRRGDAAGIRSQKSLINTRMRYLSIVDNFLANRPVGSY